MSRRLRFVLEGTWTGYTSSQARIVHRTVERTATFPRVIYFTDGTTLLLTIRAARPRERVQEIHAYDDLIARCVHHDVCSVEALMAIERVAKGGPPPCSTPSSSSTG